jgi:S-adenosylmethionine:tRNA ribosyltransferase-isomerase
MTDPKNISIRDYTYPLPDERIARYPLVERDASKLLVYKEGKITDDNYRNLAAHIPEKSLLVFNNTKVVEARLLFQKPTGGVIEIFCLEPHEQYADVTTALLQKGKVLWYCLVGGASKWKPGQVLEKESQLSGAPVIVRATYKEKRPGMFIIELSWTPAAYSFAEILHLAGAIPLPPYLKRTAEESDRERYQTVYAQHEGSVAAPTAGLHFTERIFASLKQKNTETEFVTLHVGAGTFKPVKSETMLEHEMHAEWIDVSRATIENVLNHFDKTVIAVGTTSLRTLESLYWLGLKSREFGVGSSESAAGSRACPPKLQRRWEFEPVNHPDQGTVPLELQQWEAYEMPERNISAKESLVSLLGWMKINKMDRLVAKTQLLIAPGYDFKIVKGLITNFHQPQSTLLLLVAALIGKDLPAGQAGWRSIYDHALLHDYRFLSYGDGCLLWRPSEVSE